MMALSALDGVHQILVKACVGTMNSDGFVIEVLIIVAVEMC